MVITPFAVLLLLIYTYILIKNKTTLKIFRSFFIVLAVVTLNIRMGYFFKIGDSLLAYRAICTYLTAALCIVISFRQKRIPLRLIEIVALFIFAMFINFAVAKFFPYPGPINTTEWEDYVYGVRNYGYLNGSELETGIYLVFVCNCIILIAAKFMFSEHDVKYVISRVIDFSQISILLGLVEWLITNLFHSKIITEICIAVFGLQGVQQNYLTHRGFLYAIQGATKEPSMFATTIFYLSILIIVESLFENGNRTKRNILLACCGILLLINPTLSSYVYLLIDIVLYFVFKLRNSNRKHGFKVVLRASIIIFISIVLIVFTAIYAQDLTSSSNYILQRIGNAIVQVQNIISGSTLTYSSEAIRLSSIFYTFGMWIQRPFLGYGIGSLSCHSGIVTFLFGGGVACFLLYVGVLLRFVQTGRKLLIQNLYFVISIFIVPNLFLNDYETIMCIVIPLACYGYSLSIFSNNSAKASFSADPRIVKNET